METKKPEIKKKARSPIEIFFSLGDRVTKSPEQKILFDYIFMWIIFCAFSTILLSNLYKFFFVAQDWTYLGWSAVMVGILWFQYNNLKQFYGMRKMLREQASKPQEPMKIESVEEMIKEFKKDAPKK